MDYIELFRNLVGFFVILLFSLCFHEYAHGFVARLRGDNTAEMMGRLTMNPISHMDMTGTVILPILTIFLNASGAHLPLFGWAKPVPVNARNLKNPRSDMFWVALAGPASNVLLAIIGGFLMVAAARFMATSSMTGGIEKLLVNFIGTNMFLAIFNMIPLNPLDGGKVLARFLPTELNYKLEQNEHITSILLLILLVSGAMQWLAHPVYLATNGIVNFFMGVML